MKCLHWTKLHVPPQWKDAWVSSKYAESDASVSLNETAAGDAAGRNATDFDGNVTNRTATAEPTQSPMADPFSWVSSNGEDYLSSNINNDSPWWNQGRSSGASKMSPCIIIAFAASFILRLRWSERSRRNNLSRTSTLAVCPSVLHNLRLRLNWNIEVWYSNQPNCLFMQMR